MYSKEPIRWRWVALGFVVFIVLAGTAGRVDYEDALREEQLYCDNVKLYKDTAGAKGWPDYRELYNTMCVKDRENTKTISNT
jgi:hypothetical protein